MRSSSPGPARTPPPSASYRGPGCSPGRTYDTWEGLSAGLFAPLAAGGSVVLCRHIGQLDADGLAKRVESERVTNTAV